MPVVQPVDARLENELAVIVNQLLVRYQPVEVVGALLAFAAEISGEGVVPDDLSKVPDELAATVCAYVQHFLKDADIRASRARAFGATGNLQ